MTKIKTLITYFHAIRLGLLDGYNSPTDLGMGWTWEDNQTANEFYDRSVNVGQVVGRFVLRIMPASHKNRTSYWVSIDGQIDSSEDDDDPGALYGQADDGTRLAIIMDDRSVEATELQVKILLELDWITSHGPDEYHLTDNGAMWAGTEMDVQAMLDAAAEHFPDVVAAATLAHNRHA